MLGGIRYLPQLCSTLFTEAGSLSELTDWAGLAASLPWDPQSPLCMSTGITSEFPQPLLVCLCLFCM